MQSINFDTAKLRWPDCEITGDGRIAVYCWMHKTVQLCQTPMLARAIASEKCGTNCEPLIRVLDAPPMRYVPNTMTIPQYGKDDE